jgi:hypothetical protein
MAKNSLLLLVLSTCILLAAAPGSAAGDDIPRTASGRPDLTGNYDLAGLTPFERNPQHGDRQFLTREEAEAIEKMAAAGIAFASQASDPDRDAPPAGGDGSPGAAGAVGGYNAFWVDPGTRAFEHDGKFRTSILVDPPNGRMPALSEAGKKRRADFHPYAYKNTGDAWWLDSGDDPYDGPESLSLLDRCLYVSVATLPPRPILYNNIKTIVQTDDTVAILVEWMHWTRIIRLDSEHLPSDIRSMGGDSIGWWEGDTLVVDTTNFLEKPGVPRDDLHIVERFTRTEDSLLYEFTVNDPDYEAPYSGEFPWPQTSDKLYEYACHEGNYALGNILRGARLLEKETIEKRRSSGGQ